LREESEQLSGHISQDKVGTNPKDKFLCVLISFVVVGGHTVRICTVRIARREGTIFEVACWHGNRGCLQCFLVAIGPYYLGRTAYYGHVFLGIVFKVGHIAVRIWHNFQGKICGGQFWYCEVFSLGWKLWVCC
jgi:hypothetical protein